jgi:hypothetical protein
VHTADAVDSQTVGIDDEPAFSYLASVSGKCPTCGAPLKWAEIQKWRDEDGRPTIDQRWLVCQNNHLTPG